MMDWTDRDCRYFLRLLSPRALLYTEMVTAQAVVRGDPERVLGYSPAEQPLVLQLGGSDPVVLGEAARRATSWGYRALNLNVGCPSSRVVEGAFGACLMKDPGRVADCVAALLGAGAPVSVKTRIGVDDRDDYPSLVEFVTRVSAAGCHHFIVHARKAWLNGLSPHENRTLPPLRYDVVHRLRSDFPTLRIDINGGITTVAAVREQLARVDGVMIGRQAYAEPWLLAELEAAGLVGPGGERRPLPERAAIVSAMADYAERRVAAGAPLRQVVRHLLGLYHGQPGGRVWRRFLSEGLVDRGATPDLLRRSLAVLPVPASRAA